MSPDPCRKIGTAQILQAAAAAGVLGVSVDSSPRLLATLCSSNTTSRQIAALVRGEPLLYARVLRVANSPLYGQPSRVATIERALILLGSDAVRGIAAAVCLDRTMAASLGPARFDIRRLLLHSLATAAAAEWLARAACVDLAPNAFIAGLMHNLGILLQIHLDPDGIRSMIEARHASSNADTRELEIKLAAVGHEECGATIFRAWQLPEELIAAAEHHHGPAAAPQAHRRIAALVNVAANVALAIGNTYLLEPTATPVPTSALNLLELSPDDWENALLEVPARFLALRGAVIGP